jgi:hypothetical protein
MVPASGHATVPNRLRILQQEDIARRTPEATGEQIKDLNG